MRKGNRAKAPSLQHGVQAGVLLFLAAVFLLIPASAFYGESGVRWVSVVMLYPGLLLIFGVIAFSDIRALIVGVGSRQQLTLDSVFPVVFLDGRGFCFGFAFVVFFKMLIKAALGSDYQA